MTTTCTPLGRTRAAILALVLDAAAAGRCPSWRELCRAAGRSPHCVDGHLRALRAAGLVAWEGGRKRTLRPACRWVPADEMGRADGPELAGRQVGGGELARGTGSR